MAVIIYEVLETDSPNSGRIKWNNSDSNLKTAVDLNTAARTGIGDVVGTTATQTLTHKTLSSSNAGGTNIITINRKDISGNFLSFTSDSGTKTISVNGASLPDIDLLGDNGIETEVSGGIIYAQHPTDTVLNKASQTFAVACSGVTSNFTADIDGHTRITEGLAIGSDHSDISGDFFHIKDTDNISYVSSTIQNVGTGGSQLKLMEDITTKYWFLRYDAGADNGLSIGYKDNAWTKVAINIDDDVSDDTLSLTTGYKVGINQENPDYNIQVSSGIGIDVDQLVLAPDTTTRLEHSGGGTINWKSGAVTALQVLQTGEIGVGGNADHSTPYAMKVTGDQKVTGKIDQTGSSQSSFYSILTSNGYSGPNGFSVDSSGNVTTAGYIQTTDNLYVSGSSTFSDDITIVTGKILTVETLKAVDTDGITVKTQGGLISYFTDDSGNLGVGSSALISSGITDKFNVVGTSAFIAEAGNQIEIHGDANGNYIDSSSYTGDSSDYDDLYIRVAGDNSNANDFHIMNGADATPGDLVHTNFYIKGDDESVSINEHADDGTIAPEVFNIYGAGGNDSSRPFHFHIGGESNLTVNAIYDGGWERSEDHNAASISLSDSYLDFSVAGDGSKGDSITWTDFIRVNPENGHIGVLGAPDSSYSLNINNGLYADSIETSSVTTSNFIITSGTASDQFIVSPGNSEIILDNNIEVTTESENGLILTSVDESTKTPKLVLNDSVGGGSFATFQGTTDGANEQRATVAGNKLDYLYSSSIRAGDYFQAGYDQTGDRWNPVPFTVYVKPNMTYDIYDDQTFIPWSENVILPKSGVYKVTCSFGLYFKYAHHDWNKINIQTLLNGTIMGNWHWETNLEGGTEMTTGVFKNSFTSLAYRGFSSSAPLSIKVSSRKHLNKVTLYTVHLEWICPGSQFPM